MADFSTPEPGTRARLIREGLQEHPDLTPGELAVLLNRDNKGLGIDFRPADVARVKELFRDSVPPPDLADLRDYRPLFTDHIPPLREHENPHLAGDRG
jgi:hypothetical protein